MLVDTHAHINDDCYSEEEVQEIIQNMQRDNLEKIICPSFDMKSSQKSIEIANKYENVYSAVGVHPFNINLSENYLTELEKMITKKVVAIGEIGLDYSRGNENREAQIKVFLEQLNLANKLKLPVIIHLRDAYDDMLQLLKNNKNLLTFGVVIHCYSGSCEYVKELLKLGCFISFTGVITFSNAKKSVEALKVIPVERLMIETDSPYLSPVPLRGTRNEPKNVNYVFNKICEELNISPNKLDEILRQNTRNFFKI